MNLSGILLYSGRAAIFALGVGLLWIFYECFVKKAGKTAQGQDGFVGRLLFVCYLAALIQITVIRDYRRFFFFFTRAHSLSTIQIIPFQTTLEALLKGTWPFCYHLIGNMIWFVPLGMLGPFFSKRLKRGKSLFCFSFCLSGGIEIFQWLFATGVSDVDDILLNVLGALFGWLLLQLFENRKNLWGSFCIAFSMYSRIPMPYVEWTQGRMKYAMCFFPIVGAVIGILELAVIVLCQSLHLSFLGKLLPVVLPILVSGGIHMDGFLDVIDAKSSHRDREKKLEILKDPHTGAFAIIGCGVYLILYLGAFGEIGASGFSSYCLIFFITRALSGLSVVTFPMAKKSGLAAAFSDGAQKRTTSFVMTWYLGAGAVCAWILGGVIMALVMAAVSALVFWYYYSMSKREFGGITGDLAGYFLQVCELALTAAVAFVSRL